MEQHSKFRYLIQRIIKYVIRGDNLERWNEVFLGQIPDGIYQTRLSNGEEDGLIIELTSDQNCVQLIFGIVEAIRMIDEGMVQEHLYSEKELIRFKAEKFRNTIYEIFGGEFLNQIKHFSAGYAEALHLKHYIIITQNYNIEVITAWEPRIEICDN